MAQGPSLVRKRVHEQRVTKCAYTTGRPPLKRGSASCALGWPSNREELRGPEQDVPLVQPSVHKRKM